MSVRGSAARAHGTLKMKTATLATRAADNNHPLISTCFSGGLDCDHSAGAGRGIAYGNGYAPAKGQPDACVVSNG